MKASRPRSTSATRSYHYSFQHSIRRQHIGYRYMAKIGFSSNFTTRVVFGFTMTGASYGVSGILLVEPAYQD